MKNLFELIEEAKELEEQVENKTKELEKELFEVLIKEQVINELKSVQFDGDTIIIKGEYDGSIYYDCDKRAFSFADSYKSFVPEHMLNMMQIIEKVLNKYREQTNTSLAVEGISNEAVVIIGNAILSLLDTVDYNSEEYDVHYICDELNISKENKEIIIEYMKGSG